MSWIHCSLTTTSSQSRSTVKRHKARKQTRTTTNLRWARRKYPSVFFYSHHSCSSCLSERFVLIWPSRCRNKAMGLHCRGLCSSRLQFGRFSPVSNEVTRNVIDIFEAVLFRSPRQNALQSAPTDIPLAFAACRYVLRRHFGKAFNALCMTSTGVRFLPTRPVLRLLTASATCSEPLAALPMFQ